MPKVTNGAGDYPFLYTLSQAARTLDTTTGDRPVTYSNNGTLWGSEELQTGQIEDEYGAKRPAAFGTIRLRNWPTITIRDRLVGGAFNLTFKIDGIRKDYDKVETILDVHSIETL